MTTEGTTERDAVVGPAADRAAIRRWLTTLHGGSSGLVHLSATDRWTGQAFHNLDDAADWAVAHGDRKGVYVRCTSLAPAYSGSGRGTAKDSHELPGLWADLDLAGPGHAAAPAGLSLLPDVDAARELVSGLPRPTLWVHSGGGRYPWWLLHEPHLIEDLAEVQRLSTDWHAYLTAEALRRAFHVTGTGDLARVLRIPGTVNRKEGGARPCTVLEESGPRYTLAELLEAREDFASAAVPVSNKNGRARPSAGASPVDKSVRSKGTERWLSTLAAGPPCEVVAQRCELLIGGLVESSRHSTILGPLMSLLGLGRQRHQGLREAVSAVETAFLKSVKDARPEHEAADEWARALDGAVAAVSKDGALPAHPACICLVRRLQAAVEHPELFNKGVANLNERKVMRYLVMRADQTGSLLVQESQRQIGVAIDVHQSRVQVALQRLRQARWLAPTGAARRGAALSYLISDARLMEQSLSTESLTPAKYLVDTSLPALVHPLFGADGLRAGVAETFAALPERHVRLGKRVGVYSRPGASSGDALLSAYRGSPRIPLPARGRSGGSTVKDLAARTGKNPRTIRGHLARLNNHGMVRQRDGHWYRLRFDPQALVAELGIQDTSARKALEYDRQRRGYYDYLCLGRGGRPPTAAKEVLDGRVVYVDRGTGAELWSYPVERLPGETA